MLLEISTAPVSGGGVEHTFNLSSWKVQRGGQIYFSSRIARSSKGDPVLKKTKEEEGWGKRRAGRRKRKRKNSNKNKKKKEIIAPFYLLEDKRGRLMGRI